MIHDFVGRKNPEPEYPLMPQPFAEPFDLRKTTYF